MILIIFTVAELNEKQYDIFVDAIPLGIIDYRRTEDKNVKKIIKIGV